MTTLTQVSEKRYTVEEYLEQEKTAETKHEYYHGKLIPMAGEKKKANRIARNILRQIELPLLNQGFDVFFHDVKAAVKPGLVYRYPDLMAAPLSDDKDEYLVFEPILAVEVASEDSASRDRGKKLDEYTHLPSMQYYLIVYQEELLIEFYAREGENWMLQVFSQADEKIELPVFGLQLSLEEIYASVKVESGQ